MSALGRIRELRGESQRQLGKAVRVTQPSLSLIESGDLMPGRSLVHRLEKHFGLPTGWLAAAFQREWAARQEDQG